MKTRNRLLLTVLVAALVAGCCPCRSYQKRTRRPLVGTTWQLVQIDGQPVRPEGERFTLLLLADSTLAGMGACNRLTGDYAADDTRRLHLGPVASTRMRCPDAAGEDRFIAALESATHYDMDGPMLLLLSNGELRAVFQAKP